MRASLAKHIGARIFKSSQSALQADGRTPLSVVGETRLPLVRHGRSLELEALVVEDLDVDILAGTPFMASNDIAVRPAKREIIIAGTDVSSFGCPQSPQNHHAVRACYLIRAPSVNSTIWPGEFLEVDAPPELLKDSFLAIEPCADSVSSGHLKHTHAWPHPDIVQTVGGKLRLLNDTEDPLLIRKNNHFCQAHLTASDPVPEPSLIRRDEPFAQPRECIVIPRSVIDGFLSALHVKLNHPSRHQMKLVSQRYFFALDLDKALDRCSQCCHLCSSLKKVPSSLVEQSTSDPPDGIGISFAADIIKR